MTLQSNDLKAALDAANASLFAIATGEAMGDASIGEFFVMVAEQIAANVRSFEDTGALYQWRYDVMNNVKRKLGREELPIPTGNSLSAQLTKAKIVTQLGVYERTRTGTIAVLRTVATVPACAWRYKALLVAAKAIATTLDGYADATDEQLMDAAMEALDNMPVSVKTCEAELAKLVKALDKLREHETHGAVIRAACDRFGIGAADAADALALLMNAVKSVEAGDFVRKML